MTKKFENNTGGVLRVEYKGRWGAVPEELIEDQQLSLEARAVAAWLAIRPPGWIITVIALQNRLKLGRDRWRRIRNELQAAGYFVQKRSIGDDGKILWMQTFNPVPTTTIDGFANDGSAIDGSASNKRKPRGFSISKKHQTSNRSWMKSDAGILRRGKELRLEARPGESMQSYCLRLAAEERKQHGS